MIKLTIVFLILLSSFLRFYRLDELMPFIGDQGLFYLPARDILIEGVIPLVGPETSHIWIHHGAHWTYVLAVILWFFNFNPVPPAYFIAGLGVATVWLLYKTVAEIFSKRIALITAFFYATSPLVVLNARMPYHTSPIPFLTILLILAICRWLNGNVYYFPLITFLVGVLYNHEITTFVLFIPIIVILFYGFIKKKPWTKKLIDKKIIFYSLVSLLVPMTPFILYDLNNGYKQTFGFIVWVLYRIFKFPINVFNGSDVSMEFFVHVTQLIFAPSLLTSLAILFFSFIYFIYIVYKKLKKRNLDKGHVLLFLYIVIPTASLFAHRSPIEADTLLISPFVIMVIAVFFDKLLFFRIIKIPVFAAIILIGTINSYYLLSTEYLTNIGSSSRITFEERIKAVENIKKLVGGKQYSLVGKGELSNFSMFTMNYEYILWWKGYPTSKEKVDLKIVVLEKNGDIFVSKE